MLHKHLESMSDDLGKAERKTEMIEAKLLDTLSVFVVHGAARPDTHSQSGDTCHQPPSSCCGSPLPASSCLERYANLSIETARQVNSVYRFSLDFHMTASMTKCLLLHI